MAQGPTSAPQSIPPFDQSGVLPPYKSAAATDITGMSPYRATLDEFVIRYATTPERINMLRGLFQYRAALIALGVSGFQWLAGSFTEQIEVIENRPPKDIDVVTFLRRPATVRDQQSYQAFAAALSPLLNVAATKAQYALDAYAVDLDVGFPPYLVDQTRYWYGLFAHRRTNVWKGIIEVPLISVADDSTAIALI